MAVKTYTFKNDPTDETSRPRRYYVCDTTAELPSSGLLEGDLAYTKDDDAFHTADSTTTWDTVAGGGGGGAPTTVDYLVGTADAGLSNEIVVGTTPGGELGGTWASPTVDATHSGSSHAGIQSAAEATAATALSAHEADTTSVHGIANTANLVLTDDARLTNDRTPTTHDIITKHNGFPGGTSTFLRADGSFATVTATETNSGSYSPGSFTVATETYRMHVDTLNVGAAETVTVEGTGTLRIA